MVLLMKHFGFFFSAEDVFLPASITTDTVCEYSEIHIAGAVGDTQRKSSMLFSLFAEKCTVSDKNSLLE